MTRQQRHIQLLKDIAQTWPQDQPFFSTQDILAAIQMTSPRMWTAQHEYGDLTAQGMGRMLVKHFNIRSERETKGKQRRGYYRFQFEPAWAALP